jgi:mannose-6-phosphate isomerase-like protein (cupin superfamily)
MAARLSVWRGYASIRAGRRGAAAPGCGPAIPGISAGGSLSVGLYALPAGATDAQAPHSEDELYFVSGGQARVTVGDDEQAVGPGSIISVPARVPHRFHAITENLSLLVFFAPAEYSQASAPAVP